MAEWQDMLRRLREQEGLSRRELAARASVAPASVKAYETGARHPSRELLAAVLDAMKADLFLRSEVLKAAGYAPDGRSSSARLEDEWFDLLEAAEEIARSPFPACITTEVMEVAAANPAMQRAWEVDLQREMTAPFERNILSMLSTPRIADRLLNWDEAVSVPISVVKGHYGGDAALMGANPYFAAAIEHFLKGDPRYVQRFLGLWATVAPARRKARFSYPVVWHHSACGDLRFHVVVSPADQHPSLWFNDWIPVDAPTVEACRGLRDCDDRFRTFVAPDPAGVR